MSRQILQLLHRSKLVAHASGSSEEFVRPASPEQAFQDPQSSPPGLNDMEMEVANELRALQRGLPSTTGRRLSASSPLSEITASRVSCSCSARRFLLQSALSSQQVSKAQVTQAHSKRQMTSMRSSSTVQMLQPSYSK